MLKLSPQSQGEALERSAAVLMQGDLLILPTDTLYALACRAAAAGSVARVRAAKGRDDAKPLPLIAADLSQVLSLISGAPAGLETLARAFWPGPLTLVLPAAETLPGAVTSGSGSVAVRVPAHAFARQLCSRAGPLVSTSANRSGQPAPETCSAALAQVGEAASLAIDGGPGRDAPSTIVSLVGDEPSLLRAGAVSPAAVWRALGR